MEDRIIDILAEAGFEAELEVLSVTSADAQLRDIKLRRDNENVLSIQDFQLDYVWPDIRDLKTKKLTLKGVEAHLTLGENWEPSEDWLQDLFSSGSGGGGNTDDIEFPENGIEITDGSLNLKSPLGEARISIDAKIPSLEKITSEIKVEPSEFSYGEYSAIGSVSASLESSGRNLKIIGRAETDTLSNSKISIANAQLHLDGEMNMDTMTYDGTINIDGQDMSSELFAADQANIIWSGQISKPDVFEASGQWSVSAKQARSPRPARAAELAETLSLYRALSVVPVTEHYAPDLQKTVMAFLLNADVDGAGSLQYSSAGFELSPDAAVSIKAAKNSLQLMPRTKSVFFKFDAAQQLISAQMDAQFETPVGLKLTDIQLKAKSENGVRLDGIETFSADFTTNTDWFAKAEDGRPVRFGPVAASLNYAGGLNPRRLSIETAMEYDGDLPGGRVTELNLDGRLDVRLFETRQELDFTPKDNRQITMGVLETPTSWIGKDIRFDLPPTRNFFTRTKTKSTLSANLNLADFTLVQPDTETANFQSLDFNSKTLKLEGTLWPNRHQDWKVDFSDVEYESDTLPGPNTIASAEIANLTASLIPGQLPQITLKSPSLTGETPLVRLSDFEINLSGTPDAYVVDHKGGTVDVIGSEFAKSAEAAGLGRFPANGRVELKDGRFVGRSQLVVAKADNADMDVSYEFANGAGTADIDIPSILFKPKGLQPQTLVPAFRGKVARVDGEARAKLKISFADGALTSSSGSVDLVDMALGTAPGPVEGLNTTLKFTSLWPLETAGEQRLTLDSFNPGMALEDGVVRFNLIPVGVRVEAADWPIGNGSFSLDPFTWSYAAEENRMIMRVKNVDLGDFLNEVGNGKIDATGTVVGVFPIVIRGIEVLIEDGNVSVPDGGIIKYDPGPGTKAYSGEEAVAVLREQRTNEYAALAQDALREFRYRELSASLNGPLDGDVEIDLIFDGSNAKVLNQQPFRFDITVKGELFNIARSFNSNAQVKSEILRQNGKLPEGTVIGN